MASSGTWVKMFIGGAAMCIGGPALVYYVMPSEEALFSRYNPDLQRRSLENRREKQEDFDKFVTRLKDYSKGDRPIWMEWEQQAAMKKQAGVQAELDRRKEAEREADARKQEIRNSMNK